MKKNRIGVLSATAIALQIMGGAAWAGSMCPALTQTLTATAPGPVPQLKAQNAPQGLASMLLACRSQVTAPSSLATTNAPASGTGGTFTIFDVPGSAPGGPMPMSINNAGAIVGIYYDAGGNGHSFLRAPDGTVTTFDPPSAACCSGAVGINSAGVITGDYLDTSGNIDSYLRTPDGKFSTFAAPGSISYTVPSSINAAGVVTGLYIGPDQVHGFVRQANGIFTTFDPPGSINTEPSEINSSGTIVGINLVEGFVVVGFLRSADGKITSFSAPEGVLGDYPFPTLNSRGDVTGSYCSDSVCDAVYGFVRAADGSFTTLVAPGSNYGTEPTSINASGDIAGWTIPSDFSSQHGFLRTHQGTFTTIDVPGAVFTQPFAINDPGLVTGTFCDATYAVCHGFVWTKYP